MAEFYADFSSNESIHSQWVRFQQNSSYLKSISQSIDQSTNNITSITKSTVNEFSERLLNLDYSLQQSIMNSASLISGSIEKAYDDLSFDLTLNFASIGKKIQNVSSSLERLLNIVDSRLKNMISLQNQTNIYLNNLQRIMMLPDVQKEKYFHIEKGMKYYLNAMYDKDLFDIALNNFLKALEIDESDFISLHYLGLIFLYSPEHLDISKSENYFLQSYKFSIVETNYTSRREMNFIDFSMGNSNQLGEYSQNEMVALTSESLHQASICAFLRKDFAKSIELAKMGLSLKTDKLETKYQLAKSNVFYNHIDDALLLIRELIDTEPNYSIKVLSDLNLSQQPRILDLLNKISSETKEKLLTEYCNLILSVTPNTNLSPVISEIESLNQKSSFLDSIKALNIIHNKDKVISTFNIKYHFNNDFVFENDDFNKMNLYQLLKKESDFHKKKELEEFQKQNEKVALEKKKIEVLSLINKSHKMIKEISNKTSGKDLSEVITNYNNARLINVVELNPQIIRELQVIQGIQKELEKVRINRGLVLGVQVGLSLSILLVFPLSCIQNKFHTFLHPSIVFKNGFILFVIGLVIGLLVNYKKYLSIGKDFEERIKR